MRLLSATTGEMKLFFADDQRPPYAILSHTWGWEEVSFAQWQSRGTLGSQIERTEGGAKIRNCFRQALSDGFEWIWVDT